MPLPEPTARPLACCLDVPPAFAPKARYALRMLLLPLGVEPRWVGRAELGAGIYYGTAPEGLGEGVIAFTLRPETVAFFDQRRPLDPHAVTWSDRAGERWPILFGPDDLIASAFYWLSGWQEAVIPVRDVHGRFPHTASLQHALGLLTRPTVDAYREMLAERLEAAGHRIRRKTWGDGASWALCPTHDIDYLRKRRPGILYREIVHYLLRNGRREPAGARLRRFGRAMRQWTHGEDPYRTAFTRLHAETARHGGTGTFFLKAGAHGPHDVAYRLDDPFLRQRVEALAAEGFEVGLHPSYYAHTHGFYLHDEVERLAARVGRRPVSVRQHYLRYEAPTTPRLHEAAGFQIDSTLGFAGHEGFRHATCLPFQVFDVAANRALDLWEMPLSIMESALFNRRHLDLAGALAATEAVMAACRRFGGVGVMLWHNILWDELDHPDWGRHFEETLARAAASGARLAALDTALARWLTDA